MSRFTVGPELDEGIAVVVFGESKPPGSPVVTGQISLATMFETYPWKAWWPEYLEGSTGWSWAPRSFSTNISEAMGLLDGLDETWWPEVGRMCDGSWYCEVCLGGCEPHQVGPPIRWVAPTAAHAICLTLLQVPR